MDTNLLRSGTIELRAPTDGLGWGLLWLAGVCAVAVPAFTVAALPAAAGTAFVVAVVAGLVYYFRGVRTFQFDGHTLICKDLHRGQIFSVPLAGAVPVASGRELFLDDATGRRYLLGVGSPAAVQVGVNTIVGATTHAAALPLTELPAPPTLDVEAHVKRVETVAGTDLELAAKRTPLILAIFCVLVVVAPTLTNLTDLSVGWRIVVYLLFFLLYAPVERWAWIRLEFRSRSLTLVRHWPRGATTVPYDAVAAVDVYRGPLDAWSMLRIELADGTVVRSYVGGVRDHLETQSRLEARRVEQPSTRIPESLLALTDRD